MADEVVQLDHLQSTKEVIRHILHRAGLSRLRPRGRHITAHLNYKTAADRFSAIYKLGVWKVASDQTSLSGRGSELSATSNIIERLPSLLRDLGCSTLLDVGCGDWNWLRTVALPCNYIGVDIVPDVIASNMKFAGPSVTFKVANAISDALPRADAVLCRDMLFHLSFADAKAALRNIAASCEWLITTSDAAIWFNSDIDTGDFRKINLRRRPYCFAAPHMTIRDDALSPGRILGVWRTSEIQI